MENMKDIIIKHLHKDYICGWNNTIREKHSDKEVNVNDLHEILVDTFSSTTVEVECALVIFLIEKTKDINSVIEFWQKNYSRKFSLKGYNHFLSGSTATHITSIPDSYLHTNSNGYTYINRDFDNRLMRTPFDNH